MTDEKKSWLAGVFSGGSRPAQSGSAPPSSALPSDVNVARKQIADGEAVLVDVREQREWDAGHVDGAISLPLSVLKTLVDARPLEQVLPRDRVIITHCMKGIRSEAAVEILKRFGYHAYSLTLNANDLIAAGFGQQK
ncbi:MAG: rhodanese-like domain-containing protein [Pirellulaceae bacterium]